jgi:hypothetical protein
MLAVDPHPAHRNATRPGVQPFGSMLTTSRIPRAHRRQILRLSKRIVPAPESAELRRLQNSILTKMGQTVNRNPRLWYRNIEQSQGRCRNQQSVDGRRAQSSPKPRPSPWSRTISTSTVRLHSTKPFLPPNPGGWSNASNGTTLQSTGFNIKIFRPPCPANYCSSSAIPALLWRAPWRVSPCARLAAQGAGPDSLRTLSNVKGNRSAPSLPTRVTCPHSSQTNRSEPTMCVSAIPWAQSCKC